MLRLQATRTARAATTAVLLVWAFLCAGVHWLARAEARTWVDGVGLPPHTTSTQGYADGVVPSSEWGFGGVERTTYTEVPSFAHDAEG
jgi:hypothetical protein